MKRFAATMAVVLTLGFFGYQIAAAGPGWGGGYGPGGCGGYGPGSGWNAPDNKAFKAREQFLDETVELRKQIETKRAELYALYNQENPEQARIAELRGELFDLQTELRKMAIEKGVAYGGGPNCNGPYGGYNGGGPYCNGPYGGYSGNGAEKSGATGGQNYGVRANQDNSI